jgi:AraC family transcriptional regulator
MRSVVLNAQIFLGTKDRETAYPLHFATNLLHAGTSKKQHGGNVLSELALNQNACACTEIAGDVVQRCRLGTLELVESVYPRGLMLGRHQHSHAYLGYVMEGHYTETYQGTSAEATPGTIRFLPAGEIHSNAYNDGARCLLVRLSPFSLDHLREHARIIEQPGRIASPKAEWLARRLHSEFRQRDTAAALAIEGLVLEILAEGVRSTTNSYKSTPRWLQRAREMIQSNFLSVPSLTEIAAQVGVHPVHLSREFRRYFECTVGDYMRKLRIDHAEHLLVNTNTPLAEIANICGFADQSHFSSTFKRTLGVTPARFREMHKS